MPSIIQLGGNDRTDADSDLIKSAKAYIIASVPASTHPELIKLEKYLKASLNDNDRLVDNRDKEQIYWGDRVLSLRARIKSDNTKLINLRFLILITNIITWYVTQTCISETYDEIIKLVYFFYHLVIFIISGIISPEYFGYINYFEWHIPIFIFGALLIFGYQIKKKLKKN